MDLLKGFISAFMSAVSNSALYSNDHDSVNELSNKALSILNEFFIKAETLEIMILQDELVVNKSPIRDIGVHGINLIKRLKRKGISRIDFLKGVSLSELKQLVFELSSEEEIKTSAHIRKGIIDVKIGGIKFEGDVDKDSILRFTSEQVQKIKETYLNISPFKRLNVAGLEEIVINFIITFRKEVNILKLISPVKSYSEYTYTHATNVAVLSMFQAETLGIKDTVLRDIGIAALLHDVGKLFISKDILEKSSSLDEKEWEEIKLHPLYGARYLSKLEGIPALAPIVAFEHHLRFDGKGYPPLCISGKRQHLCSQAVAIADFFDALRSMRPYRRELEIKEVLSIMMRESGKMFNPFLLDNFIRSIHIALSE